VSQKNPFPLEWRESSEQSEVSEGSEKSCDLALFKEELFSLDSLVSLPCRAMRRIVAITCGTVVLFAVGLMYTVWRASQEPVTHAPGPVEVGRVQLHAQLEDAKKTEAAAEKQDWDSPEKLRAMLQGHEQRIEKLKDNKEAADIVAYDRDAVDRLQKRITQIAEQEAAKQKAAEDAAKEAAREAAREAKQAAQQAARPDAQEPQPR